MRNRRTIKELAALRAVCLGLITVASMTLACGGGGGNSLVPLEEIAAPTVIALSDVVLKEPVVRPTPSVYEPGPMDTPIELPQASVAALVPSGQPGDAATRPQASAAGQSGAGQPASAPLASAPPAAVPPVQNQAAPAPAWGATASVSKPSIAAGTTQAFAVLVDNTKSTNAVIDVEVFDRTGKRVHQAALPNLFLAAGSHRFNASWAIPKETPPGIYTVSVGVFEPNWTKLIIWKDALATFNVTPR